MLPGFRHNEQSLRVVEYLENGGMGLNLTEPVRSGILRHSKGRSSIMQSHARDPETLEAEVLKLSDGIAYMNHDLDDAVRAGIISASDVPADVLEGLGTTHSQRIDTLVTDVICQSDVASPDGHIRMSDDIRQVADVLRDFLYDTVYDPINQLPETKQKQDIVRAHFTYFVARPYEMPPLYAHARNNDPVERRVADYVASMTDRFAIEMYQSIHNPLEVQ
jgi:dGTPase